ncbi:LysE family transporter [Nonomuraea sp. NPDC049784]|uniref:LysE family translocator n=1 Tax=Nonomuraea sp. NPDC049784 TaxID=3154361 RepID=UPI0033F388A6
MPGLPHLSVFCAMSSLLAALPGPNVLFVIGRALAHGRRAALASVLGNASAAYALVIVVALGLGTVVERSALIYTVIKLGGAAYLVFLGVKAIRADGLGHTGWFGRPPRRLALAKRAGGLALIGLGPKVAMIDRTD